MYSVECRRRLLLSQWSVTSWRSSVPTSAGFVLSVSHDSVVVQPAGMREATRIDVTDCRRSRGAGVFLPGPPKRMQRCKEKILADYDEEEPWPPAASLLDLVRCMVVMDDPCARLISELEC